MPAPKPQSKATNLPAMRIAEKAEDVLNGILVTSIEKVKEYGGVIHRDDKTGELGHTGPFEGWVNGVNVHQQDANMGCPEGTTPVAWYHTHPVIWRAGVTFEWDKFIDGDLALSEGANAVHKEMDGYVGMLDGSMWRYDCKAERFAPMNNVLLKNTSDP